MPANLKTHVVGARKVLFCYMLTVALSWAAFPIIVILTSDLVFGGRVTADFCLSIYSLFTTLILCIITYLTLHGFGEKDRKPYRWARYPLKGLVCAAAAYAVVVLLEWLMIQIANRYIIVTHPKFVIETLNAYARMVFGMPFYWLFRLLEGPAGVLCPVPSVTYTNILLPGVLVLAVSAFGYWMGYSGRRIIKVQIENKFLRRILYAGPKRGGARVKWKK